jgi:hypothetical protein
MTSSLSKIENRQNLYKFKQLSLLQYIFVTYIKKSMSILCVDKEKCDKKTLTLNILIFIFIFYFCYF